MGTRPKRNQLDRRQLNTLQLGESIAVGRASKDDSSIVIAIVDVFTLFTRVNSLVQFRQPIPRTEMRRDIFRWDLKFFCRDGSDRSTCAIRDNHPVPGLPLIHRHNPIVHIGKYMVDETLDFLVNRLLNHDALGGTVVIVLDEIDNIGHSDDILYRLPRARQAV